ncbi:MAG TPA: MOSC domain-containing protein [Actinomycetota bacterium]|nr:MOSC domain-containing protein [Actinomycetota bacterium]
MPTVARLNVTPVKATRLHHPVRIRLGPRGAEGDRAFFLVDGEGRRFSGPRAARMMAVRAEHDPELGTLRFAFPDGTEVEGPARATGPALVADFWGRPVPARIVPGPWEEALSALAGEPLRVARPDRPGDAVDVRPVTLVSLASVDDLARRGGLAGRVDPGRFRMLVELEGCAPYEEDTWAGRMLVLGGAVVRAGGPVPRCAVTTKDPRTGETDLPTLRAIELARGRDPTGKLPFGIYADVVEPGEVTVGDPVHVLEG